MRNGTYVAKRRQNTADWRNDSAARSYVRGADFGSYASGSFSRNRNTVKHRGKVFGSITMTVIVGIQVIGIGLLYVSQGTKATSYDYELSSIESKIEDMEAERDDLAVERARLTSIAKSESSKVAAAMEDAKASGYAAE